MHINCRSNKADKAAYYIVFSLIVKSIIRGILTGYPKDAKEINDFKFPDEYA